MHLSTDRWQRRVLVGAVSLGLLSVPVATTTLAQAGAQQPATSAAALPTAISLTVSPRPPIRGEQVVAKGRVPTSVVRPVSVQIFRDKTWQTLRLSKTDAKGNYSLSFPVWSVAEIRVLARQVRIKGHHYTKQVSTTRVLKGLKQTSTVWMTPPLSQPGTKPAKADFARATST